MRRPRRPDGSEWHPGGAGDQWRHDGARCFHARCGEVRGGAFDYRLFRGGLDPSNSPNDWFLRSTFVVPGLPLLPIGPPSLPTDPPPEPLPPGVFPIIGP